MLSVEEIAEIAISKHGAIQDKSELSSLLRVIEQQKPKKLLEIGFGAGGTLHAFAYLLPEAELISVTKLTPINRLSVPFLRAFGKKTIPFIVLLKLFFRPKLMFRYLSKPSRYKEDLFSFINSKSQFLEALLNFSSPPLNSRTDFVFCDSASTKAISKCKSILRGKKLDVLFIDGGHSYRVVKSDYENYSPLVRSGGIIVFHDIYLRGALGVSKYWAELKGQIKGKGRVLEFVSEGGSGIGVVFK